MIIKVGTFNLNNLFSRFNFDGAIKRNPAGRLSRRHDHPLRVHRPRHVPHPRPTLAAWSRPRSRPTRPPSPAHSGDG